MYLLTLPLSPGSFLAWLRVGLIAGALAGMITRGRGYGCLSDIILGLLGALIGGWILSLFVSGQTGFLSTLLVALFGALVLIFGLRLIRLAL